ncbi:O-antigen ligase family protein [Streptomyces sp. NPDC048410]|uniref:O-antigen ligase family protein n=1 Tax=Streptomyces sp. NPDC048410 TaxID=3365545 RepID=UPI0037130DB6
MERASDKGVDRAGRNVSDGTGMILLGLCAAWALISAAAHDGRPEGMLLAVLATAAGCAAGRISGALLPVAAPCAGAAAALVVAVAMPGPMPGPAYPAPLGQAGAVAALLALATGALCCAAWSTPVPGLRPPLWLLAAAVVLAGALLGSPGGCAAGGAVLLCSVAAGSMPHRGAGLAGLAVAAGVAVGAVWGLASGVLPGGFAEEFTERIGPYRVGLWGRAVRLAREAPVWGVGPGRFGTPGDPAGRPHSAPLQLLAEQGVVGVLLLAGVFAWVLHALWRAARPTPVVLTAGSALAALAVIASVGDALSFTTVTAGAGLLAGWATARPWGEEERVPCAEPSARQERVG